MTLYALLWSVDYEGSSLLGVYDSYESAADAWAVWCQGSVTVSDDECDIREVTLGAAAQLFG